MVRQQLGITLGELVNQRRLDQLARSLTATTRPIGSLIDTVWPGQATQLYRLFKQRWLHPQRLATRPRLGKRLGYGVSNQTPAGD